MGWEQVPALTSVASYLRVCRVELSQPPHRISANTIVPAPGVGYRPHPSTATTITSSPLPAHYQSTTRLVHRARPHVSLY